ncbi:hypothetical protein O7632_01585 [Solwaraspora sp. WMMD406]|uniref:hypothetical protein n=1 Tax=Solwaraspora sp. WMMD406 TaxID=3016095 RepID=UPI002417FDEF|nr:hypothetical protein [Solwaraspora sp. WMMD406]MDG4762814.1 hypothetical protein [Solwaraspora sp. WMMD406]
MLRISRRKTRRALVRAELGEGLDHFRRAATHAAGGVGASVGPRVLAARDAVTPTADRVRDSAAQSVAATMAALAPLAVAAADGARQASQATRKVKAKNMKATKLTGMKAMAAKTKASRLKPGKSTSMKSRLMPSSGGSGRRRWPIVVGVLAAGAAIGTMVVRRRRATQWEEYDPGQAMESAGSTTGATSGSVGPKAASDGTMTSGTAATSGAKVTPPAGSKPHGDPIDQLGNDPAAAMRNGRA